MHCSKIRTSVSICVHACDANKNLELQRNEKKLGSKREWQQNEGEILDQLLLQRKILIQS